MVRFNIETGEATKLVTPPRWSRFALSRKGYRVACTVTRDTVGEQGGNNCPFAILVSLPSDSSLSSELGQYAHTSPTYIDVANRPAAAHEHVQDFLNWINRLALAIRIRDRIPTVELRAHIDDQLKAARNV